MTHLCIRNMNKCGGGVVVGWGCEFGHQLSRKLELWDLWWCFHVLENMNRFGERGFSIGWGCEFWRHLSRKLKLWNLWWPLSVFEAWVDSASGFLRLRLWSITWAGNSICGCLGDSFMDSKHEQIRWGYEFWRILSRRLKLWDLWWPFYGF